MRRWTADRMLLVTASLCVAALVGCASVRTSGIDPSGEHVFAAPPQPPPCPAPVSQPCPAPVSRPCPAPAANAPCPSQPNPVSAPPTSSGAPATAPSVPPAAGSSLDVRLTGPQQATAGDQVVFYVAVTNRGTSPAAGLIIMDRLDRGLEHRHADRDNVIKYELGNLAAGESQTRKIVLRVTQPGRLCQTVEVAAPAIARATAQACLMALPATGPAASGLPTPVPTPEPPAAPPVSVKVTGPAQQAVGEQARFAIEITNTGRTPLRGLKLLDRWDAAIVPTLATDGFYTEQGGLAWTIDELPPGASTRRDIHCKCQAASAKVCNRARVVLADGSAADGEACLEIRPAPVTPPPTPIVKPTPPPPAGEGLTLSVVGLRNPVAAGNELTYEIRVTNSGSAPSRQVAITATVPDGMTPSALGTTGSTTSAIDQQIVRFDPAAELRPGDSLVYRVRVRTKQPGQFRFRVELTVPGMPQPLAKEASTEVFQ